jgi:hypothetical protein
MLIHILLLNDASAATVNAMLHQVWSTIVGAIIRRPYMAVRA